MTATSSQQTVLIADDDPHIREVLRFALSREGYTVLEAKDGSQALDTAQQRKPDLLVLDIAMPGMDGTDVCRELRKESSVPIIFLSCKDEEIDRILGLELGGDDYVTKPFSPRELVARVRANLRRSQHDPATKTSTTATVSNCQHGLLKLDVDYFKAWWDGQPVELTATEFGLIRTLLGFPGKVYRRSELMEGAYELGQIVSDRTIDSHVRRVRNKFSAAGGDPIETVHGVGYKLKTP